MPCLPSSSGNSIHPFPTHPPAHLGTRTAPGVLCSAPVNSDPLVPQRPPARGCCLGNSYPEGSGLWRGPIPSEHHKELQLKVRNALWGATPRALFLQDLPPSCLQLSRSPEPRHFPTVLCRTTHTPVPPGLMLGYLPRPSTPGGGGVGGAFSIKWDIIKPFTFYLHQKRGILTLPKINNLKKISPGSG